MKKIWGRGTKLKENKNNYHIQLKKPEKYNSIYKINTRIIRFINNYSQKL
jgi:hypothetical protein